MMRPGVYVGEHKTTSLDIGEGSPYWKRLTLDAQIAKYLVGARALGHEPVGVLYDVIRKPQLRPFLATPEDKWEYTKEKSRTCKECKKKNATPGPHFEAVENDDGTTRNVECKDGRIITEAPRLYADVRQHDETPEEFFNRCLDDIGKNPDKYFQRGTIVRLPSEETEAARNTWETAKQIRDSQLKFHNAKTVGDRDIVGFPQNPDACETWGSFCPYFAVCADGASIYDPTLFRDSESAHEELSPELAKKRRLPLVTSSSTKTYRQCQRKYYFAYELGRRSIFESAALRFGTLMHLALEVWWKTVDLDAAIAAMEGESDPFERAKAEALMRGYHVRWKDEPLTVLAVEQEFIAPLVNPDSGRESETWQRGGKIDFIARVESQAQSATAA